MLPSPHVTKNKQQQLEVTTRSPSHVKREVAADGARLAGQGVGGADQLAPLLHHILAGKGQGHHGTADYVVHQACGWSGGSQGCYQAGALEDRQPPSIARTGEERLGGQVRIVGLSQLLGHVHKLHSHQGVALHGI